MGGLVARPCAIEPPKSCEQSYLILQIAVELEQIVGELFPGNEDHDCHSLLQPILYMLLYPVESFHAQMGILNILPFFKHLFPLDFE